MGRGNKTVVFQSPNRIGLGHMNRLAAIALAIRRIDSSVCTPFIVDGASHGFLESHNLPFLSLPSSYELYAEEGVWAHWSMQDRAQLGLALSETMLSQLNANLVVFDCLPSRGVFLAAVKADLPMALCLRKIIDETKYYARMKQVLERVRLIIVPHTAQEFPLPAYLQSKSVFVGSVVREFPQSILEIRNQAREREGKQVVITGGGGGYPGTVSFYNLALRAFSILRTRISVEGVLVTGPLFQDWPKLEMVEGMKVIPFDPNPLMRFASADVVVCQGGYNTLAELLNLGINTVCIPASRKFDDQLQRATLQAMTVNHMCLFEGTTASDLASTIEEMLRREHTVVDAAPFQNRMSGSRQAAQHLCELLKSSDV